MDRETQESWLTPTALVDFVDALRLDGYNIGVAQFIAAQDLLLLLVSRGENLHNPQRMLSLLGPLLCSTPAEQEKFPRQFMRWAEQRQFAVQGQAIVKTQSMDDALTGIARRGLRWEWTLFVGVIVALLAAAWYFWGAFIQQEITGRMPYIPPISGVDLPKIPDEAVPMLQIGGVAIGLLIVAGLTWAAWWRMTASQFLERRQSQALPDLQQVSIRVSDDSIHPSLLFLKLARLFRQRVETTSLELDADKTIVQSLAQGGWLTPQFVHRLVPPEYLVLLDRRSRNDHLAQFVEGMVNRLREHGVFITLYTFDGDPRLCFPADGKGAPQPLPKLAARHENMRLLVFAETEAFLNPVSGQVAPWARLFQRWTQRAVVTPEPADFWGGREQTLNDQVTLLPMTAEGLQSFLRIVNEEVHPDPISADADGALPPALQDRPQRWIERDAPPLEQVDTLLVDLRTYLGDAGYIWLTACAVYPELHWPITVYLGETLRDEAGSPLIEPRRLADLARLPWLRLGKIPDWLRQRLLEDLPATQEGEVRAALEALLVTAVQGRGAALDLDIARQRRDWTSRLARPLLRLLQRQAPAESPVQDYVFLDFMLQRFNLAVRVPDALRRQLLTKVGQQAGWKILLQWVGINLVISFASTILYLQLGSSNTERIISSVCLFLWSLLSGFLQWWFLRRFWKLNLLLWIGTNLIVASACDVIIMLNTSYNFIAYFFPYGLAVLGLAGILQTNLFEKSEAASARRWLIACFVAGIINTILRVFLTAQDSFPFTFVLYVPMSVAGSITFGVISGWGLLLSRTQKKFSTLSVDRFSWIMGNALASSIGALIAVIEIYLFFQLLPSDFASSGLGTGLVLTAWLITLIYGQSIQLCSFSYSFPRRWFWISSFSLALTGIIYSLAIDSGFLLSKDIWPYGILTGIFLGFVQSFVWRQSDLKPFVLLVWFLCTLLGVTTTFVLFQNLPSILNNDITKDTIEKVAIISLVFIPYGIITALPLIPMLREALRLQQSDWALQVIASLAKAGVPGRAAAVYLRAHWTPIRFKKLRRGEVVSGDAGIYLNNKLYSTISAPDEPYLLCLVTIEAKKLEMGATKARSVLGMLEAWQAGFAVHRLLTGASYHPAVSRLLALPLHASRENLRLAQRLMLEVAGAGSSIRRLPLYPWPQEVGFRLTRRELSAPASAPQAAKQSSVE